MSLTLRDIFSEKSRCERASRGMTLIEVLAAVGIICVLGAVLVSVNSQIQARALGIKCTSNLRMLASALHSYARDKNGEFTSSRWDNLSTDPGNPGFADYLGLTGTETTETVMTCPQLQKGDNPSGRPMRMNYGVNTRATARYHVNSLNRVSAVTQPSRFMLFTEGVVNPTLGSQMTGPYNYYTAISWAQKSLQQYPHTKRQNVVFLDGHVEMLEPADFPDGSSAYKRVLWSGSNP